MASALLCPRAARALGTGHGQSGHLPVEIFSGTGRAGIGNIAGGRAKPGTGMPVAHHYYTPLDAPEIAIFAEKKVF